MADQKERFLETITNPDFIQQGDFGELLAVRYYDKTPLTQKYLVVVYKEVSARDGFVLTAYLASAPSQRRISIWKR